MKKKLIAIALNTRDDADPRGAIALNFEFKPPAQVPDWIELLPVGPEIKGRDGRTWRLDDPQTAVAAFNANGADLPLDFEHATEIKGPEGEPAPAGGWIKELEVRAGAVWGRVEWNNDGGFAVSECQYRYISPVFIYGKQTRQIVRLTSAALTNQPNLLMQALNREGQQPQQEEVKMKKVYAKLGLAETATEDDALNAIGTLQGDLTTARNRAESPSLDKFVPRADYDTALNRASTAEDKLKTLAAEQLEEAINAEIDTALKGGKITPATADYHKAQCRQDGGLARFKNYVKAAPVVGDPSNLDGNDVPGAGRALNAEEQQIAAIFGNSAEDIKKYGAED